MGFSKGQVVQHSYRVEPHLPPPNRWPLCKWFEQLEFFLFLKANFVVVVSLFFFFTWVGMMVESKPTFGRVSTWYWIFILEPSHGIRIQG